MKHREIEDPWNERARGAHLQYVQASTAFRTTWDEHFENHLSDDSNLALLRGGRRESEALREYMRVLKIFSDPVLSGKTPPEA